MGEQREMVFDGKMYEPPLDKERLTGQMQRVVELMRDGNWRTLGEIARRVDGSEAGVSARLRDLRKERFATRFSVASVERRRAGGGIFEYALVLR